MRHSWLTMQVRLVVAFEREVCLATQRKSGALGQLLNRVVMSQCVSRLQTLLCRSRGGVRGAWYLVNAVNLLRDVLERLHEELVSFLRTQPQQK